MIAVVAAPAVCALSAGVLLVLARPDARAGASPRPTPTRTETRPSATVTPTTAPATATAVTTSATPPPPTPSPSRARSPSPRATTAPDSSLPARLASTGGGSQLITAVTSGSTNGARSGTLSWWERRGGRWVQVGSTSARFGVKGLSDNRVEGDGTTPTGLYGLPSAFGIKPNPGSGLPWRRVDAGSWWDENALDARYNTWYQDCPSSVCWEARTDPDHASEHLIEYTPQYNYAVVIGFNTGTAKVRPPARPSGSGIFIHVSGSGYTAGCISIGQSALVSLLRWLDPGAAPHIAIGNARSIYRY